MSFFGGKEKKYVDLTNNQQSEKARHIANNVVHEIDGLIHEDQLIKDTIQRENQLLHEIYNLHISLKKEFLIVQSHGKMNINNTKHLINGLRSKLNELKNMETRTEKFTKVSKNILKEVDKLSARFE